VLAFDMGGTRLKAAVVDGDQPFALTVAETGLSSVAAVGARLVDGADAVAMCVPGKVSEDGVVEVLPGKLPGVEGTDLRSWLKSTFGLPVAAVVNDAAAWGVAEAAARPGRARVLTVTVGTGLGTALVEGSSVRGLFSGLAFETLVKADPATRVVDALVALCFAHEPDVVVVGGGDAPGREEFPGLAQQVNERLAPWLTVDVEPAGSGDAGGVLGVARMSEGLG
jgi:predicted NBD/HSP70 family sugar kinase